MGISTPNGKWEELTTCRRCTLCETRTQVVPGVMPERFSLMLVGEAPGRDEDWTGVPFSGRSGQLLDRYLAEAGINRHEVGITNVVRCRPPENRDPRPQELAACSDWLLADLLTYRPKQVLALGKHAAAFFLNVPVKDVAITRRRGGYFTWTHPQDSTYTTDVLLTLHPAFVAREENDPQSPFPYLFLSDLCAAKTLTYADTESLPANTGIRVRQPFMAGTKFITGWHVGDQIFLTHRDDTGRLQQVRVNYPYYFFIREEDLTPTARNGLTMLIRMGIKDRAGFVYKIHRVSRDPEIPGWIRVYPSIPSHWVSKECKAALSDEEARRYVSVSPLLMLAQTFQAMGIRTFEADVDPLRRFMTDHRIEIETENLRRCWLDIETDDEAMRGKPIMEVIGNVPILSIALVRDDGQSVFRRTMGENAHEERELLSWFFYEIVPHFDIFSAWNGGGFDFPFLFKRAREHRVKVQPQATIWWDAMFSFKKNHRWDAEKSLTLDKVGDQVCGVKKIDRTGWTVKRMWREQPDFFERYNVHDSDLMRQIEEKTQYVSSDMLQNGVSNCLPANTYIGLRIDGLVLAEGYRRGTHFRTKFFGHGVEDQYIGAFVLEPILGRHWNIANFDFASLYPTTFTTWNISPDTYIPPNEVPARDPATYTRCPAFMVDGILQGGECFDSTHKGIIPSIYTNIAKRRAHYKAEMKRLPHGSPEWLQAKRLEYTWKTLGLSMYGTMGSIYARIFNRAVAQSVTLSAQFLIRSTMELARRMGFTPIYGDTDSVFIQIKDEARDVDRFMTACRGLYEASAKRLNCPVNAIELEHEQTFDAIVFTGKKHYFGKLRSQKGKVLGEGDSTLEVKGLEMRRSDGTHYGRSVQESLVNGLLYKGWDLNRTQSFLLRIRKMVFDNALSPTDLQATSGLTKEPHRYKGNSRQNPHVRIAEMKMAAGEEIIIGQKISYIVLDARESPMSVVAVEDYDGSGYDAHYYWNDKIWPPVERIVQVLWPDVDWASMKVRRKPRPRKPKTASELPQ